MLRKSNWWLTSCGTLALVGGLARSACVLAQPMDQGDTPGTSAAATSSVHWEGIPLGDAVKRLNQASSGTVVVLDRRADPTQRIDLTIKDAPVARITAELAATCSLGVSQWDGLIYVGPPDGTGQLATLAALRRQEITRLPATARRTLSRRRRIDWPRLTEPRDLVIRLMLQQGWRVEASGRIPHDLWPAGRLPALPLSDQLTVLLVGFDLTFRVVPGDAAIEMVPLGSAIALSREYDLDDVDRARIAALAERFPDARLEVVADKLHARGRWEDLEALSQLLRPRGPRRPPNRPLPLTKQLVTLRVEEQAVGAVLEALARQLNWNLVVDEAAIRRSGRSLDRRVSFAVTDADVDQLLEALLEPAGLAFQRDGSRIRVGPR